MKARVEWLLWGSLVLALVGGGEWLAAGAPTERANTGSVRLYDLGSVGNN